mmetsp:Transcript_43629/g.98497  ORF Transcript_43629/g.98497 Transcript_43629/m.98497 type:complete len:82 (-) Transcript_43629:10-255(-)
MSSSPSFGQRVRLCSTYLKMAGKPFGGLSIAGPELQNIGPCDFMEIRVTLRAECCRADNHYLAKPTAWILTSYCIVMPFSC